MASYFANGPLVFDALAGFARTHHGLVVHDSTHDFIAARHTAPARRVGLLSGGGSGHEPLHIGFVGAGMLDAACPGRIFASPHNRQIFYASCAVAREEGVLHLVKNYTGDRINFGIAAERLGREGIACARVLVDDDLASDSEAIAVGRRGTAGIVVLEKLLGAAADRGRGLADLAALGTRLTKRCRSLAVASAAHTAPATGLPAFDILPGMIEYGVGIHGERADRSIPSMPLAKLVDGMTAELLTSLAPASGSTLITVVNGLGSVTRLELYAVMSQLGEALDARGMEIGRGLVGDFVTALDMRGFSITLVVADQETLDLFDAPAHTAAWPAPHFSDRG